MYISSNDSSALNHLICEGKISWHGLAVLFLVLPQRKKIVYKCLKFFASALGNTKANRDFSKLTEFLIEIASLSNLKPFSCQG